MHVCIKKLIISAALIPSIALASDSNEVWSDSIVTLNDVTVTTIKNVNMRNDDPVSVTMLNEKDVKSRDIQSIKQAAALSPNFYIPDYGSRMPE